MLHIHITGLTRRMTAMKPWMLPIAIAVGVVFHRAIEVLSPLSTPLILLMLLITFCRLRPSQIRVGCLQWRLLAVQVLGAVAVYCALLPLLGIQVAQGALVTVLCPTATAAPVITAMLGGSLVALVSYSLVSNLAVAALAPAMFALAAGTGWESLTAAGFLEQTLSIALRVIPLIVGPLAAAMLLRRWWPRAHGVLATHQTVSFYTWVFSLIIVVGRAVGFIMAEPAGRIPDMAWLAGVSLALCVAMFAAGRRIGRRCGDPVAGAQGLAQKNTVLAIWLALTYLDPLSSVAPAAYILWQNVINSLQLWRHARSEQHSGIGSVTNRQG